MKRTPMTVRGAEILRAELKRLKSEDRPRVISAIAEARAHGPVEGGDAVQKRSVIVGCDSVVSFVTTSGTDGNDRSFEVVVVVATTAMSFVSTLYSFSLEMLPLGFRWRFQAKALD